MRLNRVPVVLLAASVPLMLCAGDSAKPAERATPAAAIAAPASPPPPIPDWQMMRLTRDKLSPLISAIEQYYTDNNSYPPADTIDQLLPFLVPDYLPAGFDASDAWSSPLRFATLRLTPGGTVVRYRLGSPGADHIWRYESLWSYAPSWMQQPNEDLIYEDGGLLTRFSDPEESIHDRYFETYRFMRIWWTALEQFVTDNNHYPPGDSFEESVTYLSPDYLGGQAFVGFPALDAWRHAIRYETWSTTAGQPPDHYCIGSSAGDRVWEHPSLRDYAYRDVNSYDDDLVLCDGVWLQLVDDPDMTPATRYRSSLGAIKTIASAVEQYNTDTNNYPRDATIDGMLTEMIAGGYLRGPIERWRQDGWRFPLRYQPMQCTPTTCSSYRLGAAGADSRWEFPDLLPYVPADTTSLSQDIILENGQFIRMCPDTVLCTVALPVQRQRKAVKSR